jgi:hypothetical protein
LKLDCNEGDEQCWKLLDAVGTSSAVEDVQLYIPCKLQSFPSISMPASPSRTDVGLVYSRHVQLTSAEADFTIAQTVTMPYAV